MKSVMDYCNALADLRNEAWSNGRYVDAEILKLAQEIIGHGGRPAMEMAIVFSKIWEDYSPYCDSKTYLQVTLPLPGGTR